MQTYLEDTVFVLTVLINAPPFPAFSICLVLFKFGLPVTVLLQVPNEAVPHLQSVGAAHLRCELAGCLRLDSSRDIFYDIRLEPEICFNLMIIFLYYSFQPIDLYS